MVIEMVQHAVFWLNAFPHTNGVSTTLSPRSIMTGRGVDHTKHCKYEFGQYVQVHDQHDNTMLPTTTGAITFQPTGNAQGNYYCLAKQQGRS